MDDPRQTAFDALAPDDERTDALGQLQREYMPTASDLAPAGALLAYADAIRAGNTDPLLAKAEVIALGPPPRKSNRGQMSDVVDPWNVPGGGYYEPPTILPYHAMRMMVRKTPVLAAAVLTRVRQIRRFCSPQAESGPGFRIRHRDRSHKPDKGEQESIRLLEQFIENSGWEWNALRRDALRRYTFGDLVSQLATDSLVLDSTGIELEWRKDGRGIAGFYPVDGATLRLTPEDGYAGDPDVFALQVIEGNKRVAFTREDLIFRPRNPSASIYSYGYGQSEVDSMVQLVTGLLNAMDYNIAGFNRNDIPQGVLHISGNFDNADADAFKSYWRNMLRGAQNRWQMPVMFSKDQESKASFEKFGVDFDEMHFAKFMSFLVSIICALFGMSPEEINTEGFSGGTTSPLSGSDTAEKLASSREKGLRPNLAYFEQLFSSYLIQPLGDKYVFEWTGLEEEDAQAKLELNKMAWTWNELREAQGLKRIGDELGDAPLNPSLIGPWMQLKQTANQEQDDFGTPPAGGGPSGSGGDDPGQGAQQAGEERQPPQGPPEQQGQQDQQEQQGPPPSFGSGKPFGKSLRVYAVA